MQMRTLEIIEIHKKLELAKKKFAERRGPAKAARERGPQRRLFGALYSRAKSRGKLKQGIQRLIQSRAAGRRLGGLRSPGKASAPSSARNSAGRKKRRALKTWNLLGDAPLSPGNAGALVCQRLSPKGSAAGLGPKALAQLIPKGKRAKKNSIRISRLKLEQKTKKSVFGFEAVAEFKRQFVNKPTFFGKLRRKHARRNAVSRRSLMRTVSRTKFMGTFVQQIRQLLKRRGFRSKERMLHQSMRKVKLPAEERPRSRALGGPPTNPSLARGPNDLGLPGAPAPNASAAHGQRVPRPDAEH